MDVSSLAAALPSLVAPTMNLKPRLAFPLHPFSARGGGAHPRGSVAVGCAHSNVPPPLRRAADEEDQGEDADPRLRLHRLAEEFRAVPEAGRARRLLAYAAALPRLGDADRVAANRVMGCVAQVWLVGRCDGAGRMRFAADSDSELSRGYCACLISALDGAHPDEVLDVDPADLAPLGVAAGTRSRASTWHNVLVGMQKRARAAIAVREGRSPAGSFPSLVIGRDGTVRAQGSYAEAQVSSPPLQFCLFSFRCLD
ncbi:hypothetical protein GUJ93_ZPchr0009g508 [Zizania palustris]|uniref:Fe-S metabolism associated domain-containing protein n=1 Tax=Zizania palustris TaxID=103762 RepID=A0A8J5VL77_ZIZPA|nr:hypothetical protein GUJ93_ZPchr0009g508 [Zizania palustris]